jgi:uncharacterized protein YkwD
MRAALSFSLLCLSAVACVARAPQAPAPAPAHAATPVVPGPAPAGTCGLASFEEAVLTRVNAVRARGANCGSAGRFGPAPPLVWNPLLARTAERHAQDMAARNFFSHTGSDGHELRQRADAVGYRWRTLAENIAGGRGTVDGVVDQWLGSPGHCANLLNPRLMEVGVACVRGGPRSTYGFYWTMALGTPP